jgi:hypothetical protein
VTAISRRRTLVLLAGTSLAGCSTIGTLFNSTGQYLPEIQGAFAAAAVLLETGAALLGSGIISKTGATTLAINKVIQDNVTPIFATAKSDVDSGSTLGQALIDQLTTAVNQLSVAVTTAKPTAAQGQAMLARKAEMQAHGFVLTIAAAIAIVQELVSLAVQYGGPIATYINSLISGITNSSTSTIATVDAAYANFSAALTAWNNAIA